MTMRMRLFVPAILALLPISSVRSADSGTPIPVHVWFRYQSHDFGTNATAVAKAVAEKLGDLCKPYVFDVGPSEPQSHLRIVLTLEASRQVSLSAQLFGFAKPNGISSVGSPQVSHCLDSNYTKGLPPEGDWPDKVAKALVCPDAISKLRTDLNHLMPFAKGIKLEKVLSPADEIRSARLFILYSAGEAWARDWAHGGPFEIPYGTEGRRLVTRGVKCFDSKVVVAPVGVLVDYSPVPGGVKGKFEAYASLGQNSAETLIFPSISVQQGLSDQRCEESRQPAAREFTGGPR